MIILKTLSSLKIFTLVKKEKYLRRLFSVVSNLTDVPSYKICHFAAFAQKNELAIFFDSANEYGSMTLIILIVMIDNDDDDDDDDDDIDVDDEDNDDDDDDDDDKRIS
jgi:hypothetical protein